MQVYHEQPWKESLCGCFNDGYTCCYGLWCCCCLYGQNAAKIDSHSTCLTHTCVYCLMSLLGCCCVIHAVKRGQLRENYGLEEDVCGDCFVTCCCPLCAICQEAREMKVRGHPPPPIIIIHQPALSLSSAADFDAYDR
ncbi:unnamed protein product [Adineta steineri]|uniref:Uncharacterized protein n=1 Tax=Adineta steineri TaxID=433720 RepID=A0A814RBR1_9BILA|nr:unnamed protein product [Adineta steineri]CAF1019234.1 unnamed protein product [Adineta steineri]CAF1060589.1 unnamed protein product [Adineta steineri]CAF1131042.1 unnamed protein product [Adineta steineri]CAF1133156.1 unnamed protein product [Adineta steineri]